MAEKLTVPAGVPREVTEGVTTAVSVSCTFGWSDCCADVRATEVGTSSTVSLPLADADVYVVSPLYVAVIESVPTGSTPVHWATPFESATAAQEAIGVPFTANAKVPDGAAVAPFGRASDAVATTCSLTRAGSGLIASDTPGVAAPIVSATTAAVLPLVEPSPLYTAPKLWLPSAGTNVYDAPLLLSCTVASVALPSVKVTVPVGVSAAVTFAVIVTEVPYVPPCGVTDSAVLLASFETENATPADELAAKSGTPLNDALMV